MAPRTRQREGREDMAYVAVECARDGDGTRHRRLDGDASRPQALKTTPLFSTSVEPRWTGFPRLDFFHFKTIIDIEISSHLWLGGGL